ncbi:MAG: DNA-processing protein DprA [Oligoflexia bacterium]
MSFFHIDLASISLASSSGDSAFLQVPAPVPRELWIEARDESQLRLLDKLPDCGLAIVGTRNAHPRALQFTRRLIEDLRTSPLIILSGLARGIDQAAHEAALVFGLPTIAVLGCGLSHTYPPENQSLRQKIIASGGLIISEFAPTLEPRPFRFVQRNRLIAAWARATCMMQASHRSGALLTADYALQLHRTVLSLPAFPGEPGFEGNQRLLDDHAVHALWGAHSLAAVGGASWLNLASSGQKIPVLEKNRQLPLDDLYGQESPRHC